MTNGTPPEDPTAAGRDAATSRTPPTELTSEWSLRGAPVIAYDGAQHPILGRWVIVARVASGGMGTVFRAVHRELGTETAVKVLHPSVGESQPGAVDRFLREARLAAALRSPHLVSVLDVARDETSGAHYLVMEYVHGCSAREWMDRCARDRRPPTAESAALDIALAATTGLAAAHAAGIVHRDVKPANILLPFDASGNPRFADAKLSDLGLARPEDAGHTITATGLGLGTPGYMPPEQAKGAADVGRAADVFAMGATIYALLAGEAPFRGATAYETIAATVECRFRPLREVRSGVTAATDALVARCLARDPADRFADAAALADAIRGVRAALGDATANATLARRIAPAPRPAAPAPSAAPSVPATAPAPRGRAVPLVAGAIAVVAVAAAVVLLRGPARDRGPGGAAGAIPAAMLVAQSPCRVQSTDPKSQLPLVRTVEPGEPFRLSHMDRVEDDPAATVVTVEDDRYQFAPNSSWGVQVPADRAPEVMFERGDVEGVFTGDGAFTIPLAQMVLPAGGAAEFRLRLEGGRDRSGAGVRAALATRMTLTCRTGAIRLEPRTPPESPPLRRLAGLGTALSAGTEVTIETERGATGADTQVLAPLSNATSIEVRVRRAGASVVLTLDPGARAEIQVRPGGAQVSAVEGSAPTASIRVQIDDGAGRTAEIGRVRLGDAPLELPRR